jgi:hypothetical protein
VDTHEIVRRSQCSSAAADLELMTPVGRKCHDWIGAHPVRAHDEGWAVWAWELNDADRLHEAELARTAASVGITWSHLDTLSDMTSQRVLVVLSPDLIERVDALAEAQRWSRAATARYLIEAALDAAAEPVHDQGVNIGPRRDEIRGHATVTGRPWGPTPKGGTR